MKKIIIQRSAVEDMKMLLPTYESEIKDIMVLIEEAENNKFIFNVFFKAYQSRPPTDYMRCDFSTIPFNVCEIISLHDDNFRIDRFRILNGHNHRLRVLYYADDCNDRVYILGLMERDVNYEESHPLIQRIKNEYRIIAR